MKILIAMPDNDYYLWQMIVQMNNLKKFGYLDDTIYVVGIRGGKPSNGLKHICENNHSNAQIFFVTDRRNNWNYACSMSGNILKEFFSLVGDKLGSTFFYIDPDVLFVKKINFSQYENTKLWYCSDTRSYLDSKYIISKSETLFNEMCDIVGIDPKVVINNDINAGGAQYILKNTTPEYWDSVEKKSEELYSHMYNTKDKYSPEYPIQFWTAEMWAVLWNAWKYGHKTKIIDALSFSWATDPILEWDKHALFHNAGVVTQSNLFNKGHFSIKSPFNTDDFSYVSDKHCSYNYVMEILDAKNNMSHLIY